MDVNWAFTGDGILAFAGGALALFGVWGSNHQSIKNLEKQLESERNADAGEADTRKRAVAKALLFEVDDFYSNHLRGVYDHYRDFDGAIEKLPGVTGMGPRPFAVYDGNTSSLGALSDAVVKSVVAFYDTARRHLPLNRDYKGLLREYHYGKRSPEAGQEAKQLFFYVRGSVPRLTRLAYDACMKLARLSGVPFQKDVVIVAGEDPERLAKDEETEANRHK